MNQEPTPPEELFSTLASDFLASGLGIDEYLKKKLSESHDLVDESDKPANGAEWADRLIKTFAEIDINHESIRKAKEEGVSRPVWLGEKLKEIIQAEASGANRKIAEEMMARIWKHLAGHDQKDKIVATLPLDDDHLGDTAKLIDDAIRLHTCESLATGKAETKTKENN